MQLKNWRIKRWIRQGWREWFIVHVAQGYRIPPFYLPIYQDKSRATHVCAIVPFAPFFLAYQIIKNIFWSIWKDLHEFLYVLLRAKENREKEEEFPLYVSHSHEDIL